MFRARRRFQWQALYVETLYTIRHRIGQSRSADAPSDQDLRDYTQNAFGVSATAHDRLMAKACQEKVTRENNN